MMKDTLDFDAVIVAAGDFPRHEIPVATLDRNRENIISCDSAANELLQRGYMPKFGIGDGDSIAPTAKKLLSDRMIVVAEQENNDLTKAVKFAVSMNMKKIAILGATGKREDHTLGNIGLLADYMDVADVVMLTDYGCFFAMNGNKTVKAKPGQQISFFCMDAAPLTVRGVKWLIENRTLTRWWQGTLNEVTEENVEIETQGKIVVFLKYEK
ncbi:MAG: thiamine diphosphokinase [Tannerella sp.]|jgi:thiamine pyrophosphokinase|nr:thiamine diphosphokinase [Tannerella sp.]